MLHPVGPRRPAVYWRRRLLLLAAAAVLAVLTTLVLHSADDGPQAGAGGPDTSTGASSVDTVLAASVGSTGAQPSRSASASAPSSAPSRSAATSAMPAPCTPTQLQVSAAVGKSHYKVGAEPVVLLQVKNAGAKPCVQDLADSQVELRIYNGESRVWGSHDCGVQPGTDLRTLPAGQAVRVSITWSGLSSQPQCAGTRQRVGAGTYTLYPLLGGHPGKAAQFSIS